jgi:tRNA (guanine-N7-)-methyltransferase
MGKDKIRRFAELHKFQHVIEAGIDEVFKTDHLVKGKWRGMYFKNNNPIILELGCGKGEYTIKLAEKNPDKNFIGVDIKGNRIWVGAKIALENKLTNVMFLRTRIEFIASFFGVDEVDEIWITFPDPQETISRRRKRLTSSIFLKKYSGFLKKDGIINLKTDNDILYNYTLELLKQNNLNLILSTFDLYNSGYVSNTGDIKTHYEQIFLKEGKPIHYLQFALNGNENINEPEK